MLKHAIKFILAMLAASVVAGVEIMAVVAPMILTILKSNALWLLLYFATAPATILFWSLNMRLKEIMEEESKDDE